MRKFIWLFVVLVLVWGGWWFAAATLTQRAIAGWFDTQQAKGDDAGFADMAMSGFPLMVQTTVNAPRVFAAGSGAGVEADRVDLKYAAYWPGHMAVELPDTPIAFVTRLWRNTLTARQARLGLRLRPGTLLTLEEATVQSSDWILRIAGSPVLAADGFVGTFRQDAADPARYLFRANIANLLPGPLIRTVLRLPDTWSESFDALSASIDVGFDAALDRHALRDGLPQPRLISLRQIEAAWGGLRVSVSGDLAVGDTGELTGNLSASADNWRGILAIAQTAGLLDADAVKRLEQVLAPLAAANGEARNLDVVISFRDGAVTAGQMDLGRAPRFPVR